MLSAKLHERTDLSNKLRDRLQLSGDTWLFTCKGGGRRPEHPLILYVGHKPDAGCPACDALRERAKARGELSEMRAKTRAFFKMAAGEEG